MTQENKNIVHLIKEFVDGEFSEVASFEKFLQIKYDINEVLNPEYEFKIKDLGFNRGMLIYSYDEIEGGCYRLVNKSFNNIHFTLRSDIDKWAGEDEDEDDDTEIEEDFIIIEDK